MRSTQPNILEIPGAKLNGKKLFENLGMPREVVVFFWKSRIMLIHLDSGRCQKFSLEVLVE